MTRKICAKPAHFFANIALPLAALLVAATAAMPAAAQSGPAAVGQDVDSFVDRTRDEASTLAYSAELTNAGDVSGAASALEAFLISNPEALAARGAYATTLCMLDDMQAGRFEGAKAVAQGADAATIAAMTKVCGTLPTPAAIAGGKEIGQ